MGPVTLYSWGLFLGLAFLIGYWFALKEIKKQGIDHEKYLWLVIYIFIGGLLGARLGYVLQFPQKYFSDLLEILNFGTGGLAFYGGLFGGLMAGWLYFWKFGFQKYGDRASKPDFWQIADILAPAIALGIFIGRIGCFLIHDHQGIITNLPWALEWPDGILRHPVAAYLSLNGLLMFLVLCSLRNRFKKPGQLFIIFLIWYGLSRFVLDFARLGDPQYFGLFINQWVSLVVLLGSIFLFFRRRASKKI